MPKSDPVAVKIARGLGDYVEDRSFRLGNYGYTIARAKGKGVSEPVVTKNKKPQQ